MANLPNDPLSTIPGTTTPNADLPAADFPDLSRIKVTDLVGPGAANRQHKALEKRDETLRLAINKIIALANAIDTTYLRRDGGNPKDSQAGVRGNLAFNNNKATGLAAGTDPGDAVNRGQHDLKADIASPTFTGTPAAPTPATNDRSTRVATTAFVGAVTDSLALTRVWDTAYDQQAVQPSVTRTGGHNENYATIELPLRYNGRLMSVLHIVTGNGNLDFDDGAHLDILFQLADNTNTVVAAAATLPLMRFDRLADSGQLSADNGHNNLAATFDLNAATGRIQIINSGSFGWSYGGGTALYGVLGVHRSIALQTSPATKILAKLYRQSGGSTNYPSVTIRGTY